MPDFLSPAMTKLETILKTFFLQRPDLKNRILTAAELTDYISWMAGTYKAGFPERFAVENIPRFVRSDWNRKVAESFLVDPNDPDMLAQLSITSVSQREDNYISADRDISAGRLLRYLPAAWHTADSFQVYYAASDGCRVHFSQEIIDLKKGAVLIVAPGILHATPCNSDDTVLTFFALRASTFERVFWNQLSESRLLAQFFRQALSGQESTAYLHFDTFGDPEILDITGKIAKELEAHRIYHSQMLNILMSAFFITLLRNYEGTARLPRTADFFWKHQYSAIFSFIQSNYIHTNIATVAEKFHYSEKQISRIVRQCTGLGYAQLVLKLKMERAAALLQLKDMTTARVAAELGYSDVSCFYRAFTKYYRQTPLAYISRSARP